ncbi:dehydration-responsive element-binding protein 1E-like [Punica granatum]|uniref:AP2/ERF domain-containing protein n=2 Tax=Punica granatum TaxID=22663 RepID=A0A218XSZ0_PUNGR|nr:dehydration-responsive element-binding protein 1E-like [Punica granatum]OWM87776.1 hypothetical protein CDL15_Pgr016472 [Punica granatum]PKI41423.1 hypothetical protein CRG98_038195 [Punica granatum]
MDIAYVCRGYDSQSFDSDCCTYTTKLAESPSPSELCTRPVVHSDEEVVLLASSKPKKRAGRRVFKETRHPVYHGVRRRNRNKWVCELREPNKRTRIWLGTYPTAEMAARAHDVGALALRGKRACLNFADSAWRLQVPASSEAADLRRVALEAAEAFQPHEARSKEEARDSTADGEEQVRETITVSSQSLFSSCPEVDVTTLPEIRTAVSEDYANCDGGDQELNMARWADRPLLSPPPSCSGHSTINWDCYDAEVHDVDITLWSYST